jgi:hypothetical protein
LEEIVIFCFLFVWGGARLKDSWSVQIGIKSVYEYNAAQITTTYTSPLSFSQSLLGYSLLTKAILQGLAALLTFALL